MSWHYSIDGARGGPVTDKEFEELIFDGIITRSSLVWREGMEEWQPLSVLRPGPAAAPARAVEVLPDGHTRCVECMQPGPTEDMVSIQKAWVCARCKPIVLQRLLEGASAASGQAWRSDDKLVLTRDASLPDRCIKCNAPANGFRMKRHLHWHPSPYFILIVSPPIYIIVALCVRKSARVEIGLCEPHRRHRNKWMIICSVTAVTAIVIMVIGLLSRGSYGVLGFFMLAFAAVAAVITGRIIAATRIDKEYVWLKGCGREYLDEFPEWPGPT